MPFWISVLEHKAMSPQEFDDLKKRKANDPEFAAMLEGAVARMFKRRRMVAADRELAIELTKQIAEEEEEEERMVAVDKELAMKLEAEIAVEEDEKERVVAMDKCFAMRLEEADEIISISSDEDED